MQTNLISNLLNTEKEAEANKILRSCVHCGFCTATCPTYQMLGDELDSPRGRIYLIKQVLEGQTVTKKTRTHLDRCLTCRSCETTCPSGVQYGRLIDIGREIVEQKTSRNPLELVIRFALRKIIPYPNRLNILLKTGNLFKLFLSDKLKRKLPVIQQPDKWPETKQQRKMLVLGGCAQQTITPQTNVSTAHVLNALGIELIEAQEVKCCGAVSHHLSATSEAIKTVKRNIDAWWPHVNNGVEAIVITASGCGVMIKDYAHLLENDELYSNKAKRISLLAKDISEILDNENLESITTNSSTKIAFHSPCTLQHGLQLNGVVENILKKAGYTLCSIENPHLCCGSAGTYSILQPDISSQLLGNKLKTLNNGRPDIIATANIGCQMHLSTESKIPVKHWIELIEDAI